MTAGMAPDAGPKNVNCRMVCCAMSVALDPMTQGSMGYLSKYNTHRTTDHLTFDIEDNVL